jgi:hypothetical protein
MSFSPINLIAFHLLRNTGDHECKDQRGSRPHRSAKGFDRV